MSSPTSRAWILLGSLLAACSAPPDSPAVSPPENLLIITLDTLRADHLGTYGYPRPTSPHLDAFAEAAFVFEDATCSVPTTLPSHVSIFTGLRPSSHGVRLNGAHPTTDLTTLFDLLAEQRGASTAGIVSAGVLGEQYLTGMGLAEVQLPARKNQYQVPAEVTTATAIDWLSAHTEGPFALWVHYYDPHEPYAPAPEFFERFDRGYDGALPDRMEVKDLVGLNDPDRSRALNAADLAHIEDLYDAEIAYLDEHLGRLLADLERQGKADSTLVVVVGDHGQALGDSAFFGHGLRLLEPVIKVPMLLRLPTQSSGARVTAPVETIDLMPTLAELFDLEAPPGLPGTSLVAEMTGRPGPRRRVRVIERRAYPDQPEVLGAALHGGDWKAVFYHDEDGSESRLLGRASTGLDGDNLWDDTSDEARLLAALTASLRAPGDAAALDLDDEQRRMLEALGYLD